MDLCCGPGRHSLQLARAGFSVTGVDRTKIYLEQARRQAKKEKLKVKLVHKDMRSFCRRDAFDAVINLFTSFGYFEDINDDRKVARNVYHSLKDKGVFLIQLMGKEVLASKFRERDWHERDNVLILEERKVCANWSWIENRWIMIKEGELEEFKVSHRIYSAVELAALLKDCGFATIDVYGDLSGAPYDRAAKMLVAVAHKER